MHGRDERRVRMLFERERQPVEVVVHDVELAGARERVRDVQRLPDPSVRLRVLGVAVRDDAVEAPGVSESSVAKSVTSMPRSWRPAAIRPATRSHGP